jgi:signal transduction histidine kinase
MKSEQELNIRLAALEKELTAKSRELAIEAALERVRARTMAMQHSDELSETAVLLYEQLYEMAHIPARLNIGIVDDEADRVEWWVTGTAGKQIDTKYITKIPGPALLTKWYQCWKEQKTSEVIEVSENELSDWFIYLRSEMGGNLNEGLIRNRMVSTVASFRNGIITFTTSEVPAKETISMLERFAGVFNLTYRRFLDLQKAELQAREAQIELALEKVRARTMAMQKSDELKEIIVTVFKKLQDVGVVMHQRSAVIIEFDKESKDFTQWIATPHYKEAVGYKTPYAEHRVLSDLFDARVSNIPFFQRKYTPEEKNSLFTHFFKHTGTVVSDAEKQAVFESEHYAVSCAFQNNSAIVIASFSGDLLSEEESEILVRFAKVFEQTYTRFLDMQKVEAQAREAQIEAALERVRSRSMAMQKSEELREVIQVIFEQLLQLNFRISNAGFLMDYKENDDGNIWMMDASTEFPSRQHLPWFDHPFNDDYLQQKNHGPELFSKVYPFEQKNSWWKCILKHLPAISEEKKARLLSSPALALSRVLLKHVGLYLLNFNGDPYSDSDNETLIRFGKVFQQSYTRFLDLEKSEAQAREAQIEAALEKVRSSSLAMQSSDELHKVVTVVLERLQDVGITMTNRPAIIIEFEKNSQDFIQWVASPEHATSMRFRSPYFNHIILTEFWQAKESGVHFYTRSYSPEEKNSYFKYFFEHSDQLPPSDEQSWIFSSQHYTLSVVLEENSSIILADLSGELLSEKENEIMMRFAKVFEQVYTRFLDLQKAEAQALEAIKRASVDRVRAEIASMRTTNDLERITPLIWNELTTLGVPFIRCGVFIIDEEQQQIETHLSRPGGESIAAFSLPYDAPGEIGQILAHWHKKQLYKQHWDETQFVEIAQNLVQQGAVRSGEKYLTDNHPTDLYLHFLPFFQGMLYVGNTKPLNDDALRLVQNLAEAFSGAYARYEDFNKLEAAKKQVDTALNKLQATQKQLIQAEKMASLGELTAGIAHEIQNPLNFVNNFSEVNKEMIDEATEEIDKGNIIEVKNILNNLKDNEEKINHHGKRADAIVKGMLQHSRASTGKKEPTDINALADEYLRLSYHGMRAKDKNFNAEIKTDFHENIGRINVVPQDIGRVLLNLFNNAFYAVSEKKKVVGDEYEPMVSVCTEKVDSKVEIHVKDNGDGIPQKIVDKIFQPFFTTKPTGQGTGLGLSLSYDIIKAHGGEIRVATKGCEGSEFIVQLPLI